VKILALYNLKGGVGKTSAAVNLAYMAAQQGIPTLLWDLDAQGAATWYLGVETGLETSAKKLFRGKSPLGQEVRPTRFPALEVLPADVSFRNLDDRIEKGGDGRRLLQELVAPFAETYGLLVLDCPPSFSRLAESVVQAADMVLSPTIPAPLSLRAWLQMQSHFGSRKYARGKLVSFFSMVDRRRTLHRNWTDQPPDALSGGLRAWIPYATQVEQMGVRRAPIEVFAPRAAVSHAFRGLWREVARRAAVG
jgi:cellulose biosynthesis protein BcsQ